MFSSKVGKGGKIVQAQDLIQRVEAYDLDLAHDLKKFIGARRLGLVYEESKPEYVRLTNKPVIVGDLVNVLPPRGVRENLNDDSDENDEIWRVFSLDGAEATLVSPDGEKTKTANSADLVSIARFDCPIYCGLTETGFIQHGDDRPWHSVINGENYYALESLMFSYQGQIDCIYIDPPFNSGARDWKYNNNYVGKDDAYKHSKWLTFMKDRLTLAQKLLNPNCSVLIVAIDENELHRLSLLLEQLFPHAKMQMVTVLINPAGASIIDQFSRSDEQLLFVQIGSAQPIRTYTDTTPGTSTVVDEDGNVKTFSWESLLRSGGNSRRQDTKAKFFPVYIDEKSKKIIGCGDHLPEGVPRKDAPPKPNGCIEQWPMKKDGTEACWQLSAPTFRKYMQEGRIKLGRRNKKTGRWGISFLTKGYMAAIERGDLVVKGKDENGSLIVENAPDRHIAQKGKTIWTNIAYSATEYGSTLLKKFLPKRKFTFPKSLYAVEDALRYYVGDKPDAIVLDFFGGSGTTAHAVMRLNRQDGGTRKSIVITNNEVSAEEAEEMSKRGLRPGDEEWEKQGICSFITIPRLTSAITGIDVEGNPIEGTYGVPNPSVPDAFPIAEGFSENIRFFDLEYLESSVISADLAFDEIAPFLWMRAGSVGPIIKHGNTYEITESYGVLLILLMPHLLCVNVASAMLTIFL